jgi:hypothetical protein
VKLAAGSDEEDGKERGEREGGRGGKIGVYQQQQRMM